MSESAFAQVIDWARYYARVGLSVIPTAKGQKSPGVAWERFQERCPTGSEIDSWFTNFYRECGCGMVTGQVSRNIFVIDADAGPGKQGVENLDELQMLHDDLPDTWQAKSGGGGRHYFLQAPPHLRIKTGKNVLGLHVDVRGEGGFIVLAPSMHPSGNRYEWIPGMDPSSDTPIAMAPDWLLNLVVDTAPQPAVRPDRPLGVALDEKDYLGEFNAFGMRVDGREQYMRDLIWARLLEERRDSPIPPAGSVLETILAELWEVFERKVKARGGSLEADRRGIGEMRRKLGYALKKWDTRIATDAGKPKPGGTWDGIKENKPNSEAEPSSPPPDPGKPLILTAKQFVSGFTPPEYLVDGILQRGYLYSLTARTGHGKTVVSMYIAQCITRGVPMHGKDVLRGGVLFLAGENPDDIRARTLVLANSHGYVAEDVPLHFIAGVVDLAAAMPRIHAEVVDIMDLRLVIVDTAAAYFRGDDANSNAQQGAYARLLRELTFLKGLPAVIVNSHPIKHAQKDNLLPAGGGSFVNEVDGNLTLWSEVGHQTELHWQGKFRGPEFEPMSFRMDVVTCDSVVDAKGRLMPSVIAMPIGELEIEATEAATEADENALLRVVHLNPNLSVRGIATRLGWMSDIGRPHVGRVQRTINRLASGKFLVKTRNRRVRITTSGKREIGVQNDD